MSSPIQQLDRIPPTATAYVIATAIIAGVTGYFIGQGASLGLFSSTENREGWPNSYNVKVHRGSSDEESDDDDDDEYESDDDEQEGELGNFEQNTDEVKLVLAVRTDLGMSKGMSCQVIFKRVGYLYNCL